MKYLATIGSLLLCLVLVPGAQAQTASSSVSYAGGWNMAGGPGGTSFSGAASFYAWQNGEYVATANRVAAACQGYWAYFNTPSSVALPASQDPATQTCPLQVGWNLVGNPFTADALLPAGVLAYHWNTQRAAYDVVSTLHAGEAMWTYSATSGAVTVTRFPAPAPAQSGGVPPTLTINALSGPGPYQIHVGDAVRVTVPYLVSATTTADSKYLSLEGSGYQVELTCVGDPLCQMNPTVQFWTYRAIAPGTTAITVTPPCNGAICGAPIQTIQITVLPQART